MFLFRRAYPCSRVGECVSGCVGAWVGARVSGRGRTFLLLLLLLNLVCSRYTPRRRLSSAPGGFPAQGGRR